MPVDLASPTPNRSCQAYGGCKVHSARTVEFFSRFANDWGTFYAPNGGMQARVTRFHSAIAARLPKGATILDFGCGTGDLTAAIRSSGYEAVGTDASPVMISFARQRNHLIASTFFETTSDGTIPVAANTCEAVIASSVLEYLPEIPPVISEFNRVLRPGGLVFATVPNPGHRIRRIEGRAQRVLANWFGIWLSTSSPWFLRRRLQYLIISVNRFDNSGWEQLFRAGGFTLLSVADPDSTLPMLILQKAPEPKH